MNSIKRGEIYYADLSPVVGREQGGTRPVLILQNDTGNHFSSTTIVAPITSVPKKSKQPAHIFIDYDFLESASVVLLEQLRTVDKRRLSDYLGKLSQQGMHRVESAMAVSLGMRQKKEVTHHEWPKQRRPCLWTEYAPAFAVYGTDYRGRIPQHDQAANGAL